MKDAVKTVGDSSHLIGRINQGEECVHKCYFFLALFEDTLVGFAGGVVGFILTVIRRIVVGYLRNFHLSKTFKSFIDAFNIDHLESFIVDKVGGARWDHQAGDEGMA